MEGLDGFTAGNSRTTNGTLASVLDQGPEVEMQTEVGGASTTKLAQQLHEEQELRAQAEADSEDKGRRLAVATEQLAEYASAKKTEASALATQAEAMRAAFGGAAASTPEQLQQQFEGLMKTLEDAVQEAHAFAKQAWLDADRAKVGGGGGGGEKDAEEEQESDTPMCTGAGERDGKRARQGDEGLDAADVELAPAGLDGAGGRKAAAAFGSVAERAKWIPLRLDLTERKLLRLLEAALNVSEYTDKVDVMSHRSKTQRIHAQLKDICAILSGLLVASDYRKGQKLLVDRNFSDNAEFFQAVFEVGRRHKVMNPEKMRSEYGKLVYLLMDSQLPEIQELLEFKCVRPLQTVHTFLAERGSEALLEDPLVPVATREILADGKPRPTVQREIKEKEKARDAVARKYCHGRLSEDEIRHCMYSIGDNSSYLRFNRDPVDQMIGYLEQYFRPDAIEQGFSLAISGGMGGARLTHSHERQYRYVLQSLSLWRDIANDMFRLWCLAEEDLLKEGNFYRLTNTGQGLNRVQQASKTSSAMGQLLHTCQRRLGRWEGSSVIHLGDHNVPNALMFIDKYTQVPRILNPIVIVLKNIPALMKDAKLRQYVESTFGSAEELTKDILVDFFRHGFDGSGADNFFDAGSCIDGRLTSAWNWCSKLEKKPYYSVFKLAGFTSFDGDFQK